MKRILSTKLFNNILRYMLYSAVLLLVVSVGVTFGKFTFTTNASDSARVAKYSVSVECLEPLVEASNSGIVTFAPLETAEYIFIVTNENSEVAVSVILTVLTVSGYALPTYDIYDLGTSSTGTGSLISTLPFSFDLEVDEFRYVRLVFTGSSAGSTQEVLSLDVMTSQKQV